MAKRKKVIRGKAPKHEAKAEPVTKCERVRALCERECGVMLLDIVRELHVSKPAATSLIGDLRRKGIKVQRTDVDGLSVWKI
jgi:hypothetical protein